MTVRFGYYRLAFYIYTFVLSGVILGLAANFAELFLPNLHRDFTIFALIIPSLTILAFLILLQWATPQIESISLTILGILWLTMAAWSTDIIGYVQCDALEGQKMNSKSGQTSFQSYCYKMKSIQALSWALFAAFLIAFFILMKLISLAERWGRWQIWHEPIRELPWFGEMPGYYNTSAHGMTYPHSPSPGMYPYFPQMPMTQPGHSIIIQPGVNGAPPTVTQVPLSA